MSYPQFIAIDGSSFEEHAHPVAIAWSLPDGQIKTTLIAPEDDWDDWDISLQDLHGINPDTLYQRGETGWVDSPLSRSRNGHELPAVYCHRRQLLRRTRPSGCHRLVAAGWPDQNHPDRPGRRLGRLGHQSAGPARYQSRHPVPAW